MVRYFSVIPALVPANPEFGLVTAYDTTFLNHRHASACATLQVRREYCTGLAEMPTYPNAEATTATV